MTRSTGKRIHNRDLAGQQFGRWTVIERAERDKHRFACWLCRCQCGTIKSVNENTLVRGKSTSCGCLTKEANSQRGTHGESHKTRLYRCWQLMRRRCNNPNSTEYHYYGARGITVCARWEKYEHFRDDMGDHPGDGYSIDRIDNDRGYEPDNCRWATRSQQSSNQRKQSCPACGKVCNSGAGLKQHERIHHANA